MCAEGGAQVGLMKATRLGKWDCEAMGGRSSIKTGMLYGRGGEVGRTGRGGDGKEGYRMMNAVIVT